MIDTISMKNIAVYQTETKLTGCRKINLIYGNNGTGKTILSNYLRNPNDPFYRDCAIHWENGEPLSIFVFNKKFCEDNFGRTEIPGIFTLGQENAAAEEKAEAIRKNILSEKQSLSEIQDAYQSLNERKQIRQNKCIDSLWERVRIYKQLLGDYFVKPMSKIQCFNKVETAACRGLSNAVINIPDLKYRADVLNAQKEVQYSMYPYFDDSDLTEIEEDSLWSEVISENSGSEDEQTAAWIHQGAQFVKEDHICPFCGQEILSEDTLVRIKSSKSDEYSQKAELCDRLAARYEMMIQRFLHTAENILKENRDDGSAFLDVNRFSDTLTNLRNLFHANLLFMQRKKNSLSMPVQIQSSLELTEMLNQLIDESNAGSSQANSMLMNLRKSKEELKKDAWDSFCKASEADMLSYKNDTREIEEEIKKFSGMIQQSQAAIQQLESEMEKLLRCMANIRESVERINAELDSLGISSFRLNLTENQSSYVIERADGSFAAETLSDGEKTLIMLLYFLQLIGGSAVKESISTERIVVIDDPVSNLDDTALNAVLERIGKLISEILDGDDFVRQLFVLSHRKECTKKLRASDPRLENNRNVKLWILRKKNGITQAQEFALS